ncbi:MAG: YdeI/OmpD-associated family protein [Pelobium sp.]
MIHHVAVIHQFEKMGEKTGWTYVEIPQAIAHEIKADCKVSFRVKGKIDEVAIFGLALIPMGEGNFILALKKDLLKKIGKRKETMVKLILTEDKDFKYEIPEDLAACFEDAVGTLDQFLKQPKSHQNYFIRWINEAKTDATRVKRLSMTINAMIEKQDFGEMIRKARV